MPALCAALLLLVVHAGLAGEALDTGALDLAHAAGACILALVRPACSRSA